METIQDPYISLARQIETNNSLLKTLYMICKALVVSPETLRDGSALLMNFEILIGDDERVSVDRRCQDELSFYEDVVSCAGIPTEERTPIQENELVELLYYFVMKKQKPNIPLWENIFTKWNKFSNLMKCIQENIYMLKTLFCGVADLFKMLDHSAVLSLLHGGPLDPISKQSMGVIITECMPNRVINFICQINKSVLHSNPDMLMEVLLRSYIPERFEDMNKLLSSTNYKGCTVLFTARSADAISKIYGGHYTHRLYSLLSVQDIAGNTALHSNPDVVTELLQRTYRTNLWGKLYQLLAMRNYRGCTILFYIKSVKACSLLFENRYDDLSKLLRMKDMHSLTALHCRPWANLTLLKSICLNQWQLWNHVHQLMVDKATKRANSALLPAFISTFSSGHSMPLTEPEIGQLLKLFTQKDQFGSTVFHDYPGLMIKFVFDLCVPHNMHQLRQLFSVYNQANQNVLINIKSPDLVIELYKDHPYEFFDLLAVQDTPRKRTALHTNGTVIKDALKGMYHPSHFGRIDELLLLRDIDGCTSLFYFSMKDLVELVYIDCPINLYILLTCQNNRGKTAISNKDELYPNLSKNSWVIDLLESHYTVSSQDQLRKILESLHCTPWLLEQAVKGCYVLYEEPTVLIVYTTNSRPGAKKEAESLKTAFEQMKYENVKVVEGASKNKILQTISDSASEARSALIVVLLAHGNGDAILDYKGEPIPFPDIESVICNGVQLKEKPKILITQCCRSGVGSAGDSQSSYDPGIARNSKTVRQKSYFEPTHNHFCCIMSTVAGVRSERNLFIPRLAEQIVQCRKNECITELFTKTTNKMVQDGCVQDPILSTTLKAKFCLANYKARYE